MILAKSELITTLDHKTHQKNRTTVENKKKCKNYTVKTLEAKKKKFQTEVIIQMIYLSLV